MGLNGQKARDVLEGIAQVDVERFQLQLAGFDFREVQNVIDDGQQRGAAVADGLRVIALQGVEPGIEQQLGHAEHAVHGRANLVAHVGQELALRTVGHSATRTAVSVAISASLRSVIS